MKLIEINLQNIINICKKYRVKTLSVFGSILTDKFNSESDIDLSVTFENDITYHNYYDNFYGLYENLKALFKREIDLVDESALKNKYFIAELEETKRRIYG